MTYEMMRNVHIAPAPRTMRIIILLTVVLCAVSHIHDEVAESSPFTELAPGQLTLDEYAALKKTKAGRRTKYSRGNNNMQIRDTDMILSPDQYDFLYEKKRRGRTRYKATRDPRKRWTDNTVPFLIDAGFFNEEETAELHKAMETLSNLTCITFREKKDTDKNWVKFTDAGNGCNAALGMTGNGEQGVFLGKNCKWRGLYLHEIGHALGLIHEHQRPDRDNHVKIIWRRIRPALISAFTKYENDKINDFGIPYDHSSVMHYEAEAFNDDMEFTMVPKEEWRVEQMIRVFLKTLSFTDTKILNRMYKCARKCKRRRCPGEAYPDKNCKCVTPKDIHDELCVNEESDEVCYEKVKKGACGSSNTAAFMNIKCRKACGSCSSYNLPQYRNRLTQPIYACTDRYHEPDRCKQWAAAGECEKNESWMKRYCRRSCNACHWSKGQCRNYYLGFADDVKCDKIAAAKHCVEKYPHILAGCQDSCNKCGYQIPGNCTDDVASCPAMAQSGECDGYLPTAGNRQAVCRKSCNSCHIGAGNCEDEMATWRCRQAAVQGKCRLEHQIYKAKCRHTCNSCEYGKKDESCVDIHPPFACDIYYNAGTCEEPDNKGFAYNFCARSCNKCAYMRDPPCEDLSEHCTYWKNNGQCLLNYKPMSVTCPKSCDTCGRYKNGTCANSQHDALCEVMRLDGECERDPLTMSRDCRRSCGYCEAEPIERDWECNDVAPERTCVFWKNTGVCESKSLHAKALCHKTCGHCENDEDNE